MEKGLLPNLSPAIKREISGVYSAANFVWHLTEIGDFEPEDNDEDALVEFNFGIGPFNQDNPDSIFYGITVFTNKAQNKIIRVTSWATENLDYKSKEHSNVSSAVAALKKDADIQEYKIKVETEMMLKVFSQIKGL